MDLKQPLTFEEQVERLRANGIVISNDSSARSFLEHVNYYRLTGYVLQFRKSPGNSMIESGHSFEELTKLYDFDTALRDCLRKYLESVEVYYKTQIAHYFSLEKCLDPPHDQHYDPSNYYNKDGFEKIMTAFEREEGYYLDSLIVKHHKNKYNGKMPLWVMVELMSFSNVSKLYNAMYRSSEINIAKHLKVSCPTLINHLHCLSVLRNKCAHGARLYNTHFNPPAKLSTTFLQNNPSVNNASLFAYILVLKWRLPTNAERQSLKKDLAELLGRYKDVVDLSLIGFPANYKNIM